MITSGTGSHFGSAVWGRSAWSPICRCGIITKITRSTSRISINGTMFTSDKIPCLPPREAKARSRLAGKEWTLRRGLSHRARKTTKDELLAGLELGGDQADLIDTSFVHNVNGASDLHEQDVVIALDEGDLLGTILKNLFHASAELIPIGILVIDFQLIAL